MGTRFCGGHHAPTGTHGNLVRNSFIPNAECLELVEPLPQRQTDSRKEPNATAVK